MAKSASAPRLIEAEAEERDGRVPDDLRDKLAEARRPLSRTSALETFERWRTPEDRCAGQLRHPDIGSLDELLPPLEPTVPEDDQPERATEQSVQRRKTFWETRHWWQR